MACPSEIPDDAAEFESHIVDAPRNIEGRAEQEAKWAGDYDGRQHWSLREAYLKHRDRLRQAQGDLYRVKMLLDAHFTSQSSCLKDLDLSILERIADFGFSQGPAVGFLANWRRAPKPVAAASDRPGIRFMARKRPLLPFEVAAGDWDCVTVSRSCARVVCHDGRLHRTGRRLEMLHKKFVLDQAYDSSVSDSEFYEDAVKPLVTSLKEEEAATIICYGQTGTGKTHTFNACWKRLGADLAGRSIAVTFFEIHGKKCYDLLQQRKEVTLRSDAEERVHVRGALTLSADAAALPSLLEEALRLRRSEATERNPLSSRSHAVCILALDGGTTTLRFVDLAGSERNYETRSMTAQQHRDFAEINKSLMALKDCFRAHAQLLRQKSTRVPYRSSSLTQVLRSCFTPEHRTLILATISPTATDLLHSTNSLLQVTQMSKALSALRSECCVELPLTSFMASRPLWEWSNEEVNLWIRTVNNGLFKYLVLPPKITGAMLLQLSSQGLAQLFDMSLRSARGMGEGEAWNEALASDVGQRVGKLLFAAVRREAMRWPLEVKDLPLQLRREAAEREMLEEGLGLPPEAERHCEFFFWGETVPPTE